MLLLITYCPRCGCVEAARNNESLEDQINAREFARQQERAGRRVHSVDYSDSQAPLAWCQCQGQSQTTKHQSQMPGSTIKETPNCFSTEF